MLPTKVWPSVGTVPQRLLWRVSTYITANHGCCGKWQTLTSDTQVQTTYLWVLLHRTVVNFPSIKKHWEFTVVSWNGAQNTTHLFSYGVSTTQRNAQQAYILRPNFAHSKQTCISQFLQSHIRGSWLLLPLLALRMKFWAVWCSLRWMSILSDIPTVESRNQPLFHAFNLHNWELIRFQQGEA